MKNMSLIKIATACNGVYNGVDSLLSHEVSGVTIDSRNIQPGYLFIPIKGARVDGHDYIEQVMNNGALCTLSEHELPDVSYPYILVSSCEQALKDIAEHYRTSLDIKVVGITGSVGKTSTKEMISSILSQKYNVLKTIGNYNNEIGLPLTIFNLTEAHEVAVLEMGINHFDEMTRLSKIARPDIAVITNIGLSHLEFLGDRDGVLKAKTEIFEYMSPDGTVVLNGMDDKLRTIEAINYEAPIFFGLDSSSDFYVSQVESLGLEGTRCKIHLDSGDEINPLIPIPGSHMVLNALAGAAVGEILDLSSEEIQNGIEMLRPVSGRNNIIKTNDYTLIDDCYNANPISMMAALDVLATANTRTVAILGDMGELGIKENEMHYNVGAYLGNTSISVVCCIGTLAKSIIDGIHSTSNGSHQKECYYFETKDAFLNAMPKILKPNDSILIKASHSMGFEDIVNHLK